MRTAKNDVFSRKYSGRNGNPLPSLREVVAFNLLESKGGVLVELACGVACFSRMAAVRFDHVIGLDLMAERLRNARKESCDDKIDLIVGDIDAPLPFRDSAASCVVCIAAFEYAYDPYHFLDEISRILSSNGVLVLQAANIAWLPRRIRLLFGRLPATGAPLLMQDRTWNGGYLHSYTLPDLRILLEDCGFCIRKVDNSSRMRLLGRMWPNLLSSDLILLCDKRESR
jgi:ubiquinone/menaquinone biosynthesis C-methylase UbiE